MQRNVLINFGRKISNRNAALKIKFKNLAITKMKLMEKGHPLWLDDSEILSVFKLLEKSERNFRGSF